MRRAVLINGQVFNENGTPVTEPVEIQRVCGRMVHKETSSNRKGKYTIVLSDNSTNGTLQGASEGGGTSDFGAQVGGSVSQTTRTVLWGCEIRASAPGYTSSSVSLAGLDFSTPVMLGPIVIRKIGSQATGQSLSAVSSSAPEKAKKAFEKGRQAELEKKYAEAEKHLAKAIEIYPRYAIAWELRGRAQMMQGQQELAEKSFIAAIEADEKYIDPYLPLARMNAAKANWAEVLRLSDKVISLDPLNYPDAYFLNAVAHYNLKEMAEAEASARRVVDLDKEHHYPRAELLLGRILQKKGDEADAAEHLRSYLKVDPTSPEAPEIQAFLAKHDAQATAGVEANKPN